jgi:hypothetical protein
MMLPPPPPLLLLLLLLAGEARGPQPPRAAFRVLDSFSVPTCYGNGSQWPGRGQREPFASAVEATRFGISPRTRFEFVGWKCSQSGCFNNATSTAIRSYFPQIVNIVGPGNWSGDPKELVNGGVPQAANLSLQLSHIDETIDIWLPDRDFDGYSGIDFESWTPIWDDLTCPCDFYGRACAPQNPPTLALARACRVETEQLQLSGS